MFQTFFDTLTKFSVMQIFENSYAKRIYFSQKLLQCKKIARIFILIFIDKFRKKEGRRS